MRAAGAQTFYFDPGWDLFEGSAVWDVDRLGRVEDFATKLRTEYDLGLALHLMVHTKSVDEDPDIYRRKPDGSIALWVDETPYVGGYVCPASPTWQRQKIERLRALAVAEFRSSCSIFSLMNGAGWSHSTMAVASYRAAGRPSTGTASR